MPTITKRVILLAIALVSITGLVLIYLHVEIRRTVQFARQNPTQRPWWLRTPSLEEAITHTPSPSTETNGTPEEGTPPPLIPTTVTFREGVSTVDRATLEAMGVTLLQPLDGLHAIYGIPDALRDQVDSLSFVAELAPPNPQEKISSEVRELFEEDPSSPASLTVFFFQDTDEKDAINVVRTAGLSTTDTSYREGHWVIATGTQDQVTRLIEEPRVYQVWRELPPAGPCNRNAAALSHVHEVYPEGSVGPGLSGSDVTLAMWDGGWASHQELGDRVTNFQGTQVHDHANHVAGTIIATGLHDRAKGMAFQAHLNTYTWDRGLIEWAQYRADYVIANDSWGQGAAWGYSPSANPPWVWYGPPNRAEDPNLGKYSVACVEADAATKEDDVLHVCAAGNQRAYRGPDRNRRDHIHPGNNYVQYCEHYPVGYREDLDCLPGFSSAKNLLLVGAVDANKELASFSSCGPTDDGRVKPEVVAKGVDLYSCGENDSTYAIKSGTSMAAPVVTGTCGLLLEMFQSQGYLRPGQRLLASLLRALIIQTTEDLGEPGPDPKFGFGLLNAAAAVSLLQRDVEDGRWSFLKTGVLDRGQTLPFQFYSDGSTPFRATLCWADLPGRANTADRDEATPAIVHDLNLRVIGPDGNTYYPWRLNPYQPAHPATCGVNSVDTVERVDVPIPATGIYRVEISHVGTLFYPQLFSLVTNAKSYGATPFPMAPGGLMPTHGSRLIRTTRELRLMWVPQSDTLQYEVTVRDPTNASPAVYHTYWNKVTIPLRTPGTYRWSVRSANRMWISAPTEATFTYTPPEYRTPKNR